jgi:hypothetical protein
MLVHEKRTGEEISYLLELELVPQFPLPGPEWVFVEDGGGRLSARNPVTGDVR